MQELLNQTRVELKLRNYSPKTVKSYLYALKKYFAFKKENLEKLDVENIRKFLLTQQSSKLSPQTLNLYLNAVKFFYREIIKTPKKVDLKFAKKTKGLPVVLSRNEIEKIISNTNNAKHRPLLALAYGAGLRVSEAVNLRVKDIDFEELTIHLKQAKGKKDRITIFPEKLRAEIQSLVDLNKSLAFV